MNTKQVTRHANKRMQQRGITDIQLQLVEMFGTGLHQTGGATYAFVPEKVLAELRHAVDRLRDVRLISGEKGQLVTVFHESRRVHKTQLAA